MIILMESSDMMATPKEPKEFVRKGAAASGIHQKQSLKLGGGDHPGEDEDMSLMPLPRLTGL